MNNEEVGRNWDKRLESCQTLSDRDIVEEEAIVNWVDPSNPTRQIIHELMDYSASLALDPRVSQEAVNLYLQGYQDGKDQAVSRY